ncbi:MAG: nucleoside 2-deoxyribosyltransferase [Candidatus Marinimicrobia bacterium]|nr:nucleoside 2-deoxyribosyltransferase [Candidatus Neomarinimicrobiota bacterium]
MKIYFSASMSGGRDQAHLYPAIIEALQAKGEVLTAFVGDQGMTQMGETDMAPDEIYKRDIDLITQCHMMVADVTVPSLGVGVEIAHARQLGKPVLALFQLKEGRRLSAMIEGDSNITVQKYYSIIEAREAIYEYFRGHEIAE